MHEKYTFLTLYAKRENAIIIHTKGSDIYDRGTRVY